MESKNMSKAKAVSTNKVKKSREDWIFDIILYTIGVLLIIITLYPMYFIIIASFSDPRKGYSAAAGTASWFHR